MQMVQQIAAQLQAVKNGSHSGPHHQPETKGQRENREPGQRALVPVALALRGVEGDREELAGDGLPGYAAGDKFNPSVQRIELATGKVETVLRGMDGDRIRVLVGDEVLVELTPYDLTKGRITYRFMPGRGGPGQFG